MSIYISYSDLCTQPVNDCRGKLAVSSMSVEPSFSVGGLSTVLPPTPGFQSAEERANLKENSQNPETQSRGRGEEGLTRMKVF